jgi:hypothetical protein
MLESNQVQPVVSSVVTPVALEGYKIPLLNQFEGASAAYSLRRLKSWSDGENVVEVRRASDDTTRDFTAIEVSDGTMADWVNATVALPLDTASGAAAAYSLRNLSTSYTGNVVNVRRSSDSATADFTAADVADGSLETWVNTVGAGARNRTGSANWLSFTQTATGFDAVTLSAAACGYDLYGNSGDSITVTFDVVVNSGSFIVVLRDGFETGGFTVSNSESISTSGSKSFTLTATADFVALQFISAAADIEVTNFSIDVPWTNNGHVTKWYDQSGNNNHAEQTTEASQPKVVDAGTLVDGLKFDGADDYMDITGLTTLSNPFTYFMASTLDGRTGFYPTLDGIDEFDQRVVIGNEGAPLNDGMHAGSGINAASVVTDLAIRSYFFRGDATSEYVRNGVSVATGDAGSRAPSSGIRIGADHDLSGSNYSNISMKELIIYDSDQSDNRIPIESNMADYYGDIDLPPGFDSGNNEVDGYVATWYDQSGNGNDAVQNVATSQPKLVENGTYLGEVKFDGVDDKLDMPSVISTIKNVSTFLVSKAATVSQSGSPLALSRNDPNLARHYTGIISSNNFYFGYGGSDTEILLGSADTAIHLFSTTVGEATAEGWIDGNSGGTSAAVDLYSPLTRGGIGSINNRTEYKGSINEIIIYNSDQSAKRTDIEGNINDYYEIFADETYRRPDGYAIFRPDGTSVYERP